MYIFCYLCQLGEAKLWSEKLCFCFKNSLTRKWGENWKSVTSSQTSTVLLGWRAQEQNLQVRFISVSLSPLSVLNSRVKWMQTHGLWWKQTAPLTSPISIFLFSPRTCAVWELLRGREVHQWQPSGSLCRLGSPGKVWIHLHLQEGALVWSISLPLEHVTVTYKHTNCSALFLRSTDHLAPEPMSISTDSLQMSQSSSLNDSKCQIYTVSQLRAQYWILKFWVYYSSTL